MTTYHSKKEEIAEQIILSEVNNLSSGSSVVTGSGCAACHILFTLASKMQISEQDASDLLSEVLLHNLQLNEYFIQMIENIHMKQRMMGLAFFIKRREAKDRYIDSNFKNVLAELSADLVNYGVDVVFRKLLISSMSLEIAKNIGIDHHAATEELYYYMRKKDQETHENMLQLSITFMKRSRVKGYSKSYI
jgi:hypothetical protein